MEVTMSNDRSHEMGQKIRRLREINSVSLTDAARHADRSVATFRDWECKGLPWSRTGRAFMAVKSAAIEQGGYQLHLGIGL